MRVGRVVPRAVVVVALTLLSCRAAEAQGRTDAITLANGDRITGEILRMRRGQLEVKTDDAGTIEFEWAKLIGVEAVRQFEVTTSSGRRFVGRLGRDVRGSILVAGAVDNVALTIAEVTTVLPVGATLWSRFEGSVGAGFSYTRSSGVAQFNLNTSTAFRRPAFEAELTSSLTWTRQADGTQEDEPDDRASIQAGYVRFRGQRLLISGTLTFEMNQRLGLALRSQVAGMAGWRAVNSNRAQLAFGGGLSGNDEQSTDGGATQNVEGVMTVGGSYFTYDRPKTTVDVTLSYYPSLSQWGRQRLQLNSSVKRELFRDFYVGLDLYDTFDSAPPQVGALRNDFGITASISWSF